MNAKKRSRTIEVGTEESYVNVIFEAFQEKMDLLVEGMNALRQEVKGDIAGLREDLLREIMLNRQAIKSNREEIIKNRKAIEENRKAIEVNRQAIEENRKAIEVNRQAIEENRKAIEVNRQAIEGNRQAIEGNRQAIESNGHTIEGHDARLARVEAMLTQNHGDIVSLKAQFQ